MQAFALPILGRISRFTKSGILSTRPQPIAIPALESPDFKIKSRVIIVVFGSYQLDTNSGDLRKFGYRIKLQPLPKRILLSLVDEPGKAVGRDILYNRLWPNGLSTDVEHDLNTAVKKLRAVLNDDAEQPRYIETVAGIGYRFIAPVKIEGGIESPGGSSREQHS